MRLKAEISVELVRINLITVLEICTDHVEVVLYLLERVARPLDRFEFVDGMRQGSLQQVIYGVPHHPAHRSAGEVHSKLI